MNESVSIGLAGDVMIGRLVDEYLYEAKPSYIWGDFLSTLRSTDINLINLEAALTNEIKKVPKVFNFKSKPTHVASLLEGCIHIVNLANNHVLDYGEKGLIETLDTLDKANILHIGAGRDEKEARKSVIIEKKGIKIAFLGYTDNEPEWIAKNKPGTNYIEVGDKRVLSDIKKVREQADVVVVTIHWGPNMVERPTKEFIQFARSLIDAGCDILHGHSAHIFQGIEIYKEKLILYDTGDFVDDYYVDPQLRNDLSFFSIVEVNKDGISSLKIIPSVIKHFQATIAEEELKKKILKRLFLLSKELGSTISEKFLFTK